MTQTLRLGVYTFYQTPLGVAVYFCPTVIAFQPLSHKIARFANPVPLSTSLQDGRYNHVSLCPELRANLSPSLSSRTFNCHPNAVYDKPITHLHCVNIILAIGSYLCLAERCEFGFPGPTTVCQLGSGLRLKPHQQNPWTLNDTSCGRLCQWRACHNANLGS